MRRFHRTKRSAANRQAGYMLLVMMLFITMLAIGALAVVPKMEMQVKRDREEEMIHRGAQYARAIRLYVKKYGRYPLSVTDLEDTNNLHFLRKAYKDPVSGKDFRLLHMQDIQQLMMGAGGFGAAGFGPGGFTGNPGAAAGAGMQGSPAGTPVTGANGNASGNSFGSAGDTSGTAGDNPGGDNSSTASSNGNSPNGNSGGGFGASSGASGQVFGGGPIMGVASVSKDKTIRVYNNKDHYNEWLFVYDPTNDRGLITGPYQPGFGSMGIGMNGINGMNGNGMNTNGATNNTGGFGTQGMNGFQPMQQPNPGNPMPQH